jgi:membrane protein
MARLRDIPPVLRKVGVLRFLKDVWCQIGEDQVFTWASALAYSWLFAIFPFLLFLLTLVPYLPDSWKHDTKHWIAVAVYSLPKEAADTMWENLWPHIDRFLQAKASSVSIISVVLTLWGASGGVATTMAALDRCYEVEKSRPFYKQRLMLAPAVTFIEVALILAVMVLIPIGTLLTRWGEHKIAQVSAAVGMSIAATQPASQPTTAATGAIKGDAIAAASAERPPQDGPQKYIILLIAWQIFRFCLGLGLLLMAVAVVYYFGPNIKQRWRWVTPGSIFVVAVWLGLGAAFRFYVDRWGAYDKTYGTLGGVVILLLFFYVDAAVLLIGAEINSEMDFVIYNVPRGSTNFRGERWATTKEPLPPKLEEKLAEKEAAAEVSRG